MSEAGRVVERFAPDREVYIRDHLVIAALGMVGAVGVLYLMGNPSPWVGAPAALLAIAVRGGYLASEELALRWELTDRVVTGSNGRTVALTEIAKVRTLGSAVQIVSKGGDKMLMKYMGDTRAVRTRIARAAGVPVE